MDVTETLSPLEDVAFSNKTYGIATTIMAIASVVSAGASVAGLFT